MKRIFFPLLSILLVYTGMASAQVVEEDVILRTDSAELHGTFLVPFDVKHTAVLIISGGGAVNKDGNVPMGIQTDSYKQLADSLAAHGYATLRYDKRGVGQNTDIGSDIRKLRFDDYIHDAEAMIRYLKVTKDFNRVIVIGDNEGAWIGMSAARTTGASACILLNCSAKPFDAAVKEQLASQPKEATMELMDLFGRLKRKERVDALNETQSSFISVDLLPYLASVLPYDPLTEISRLTSPVLLITGGQDEFTNHAEMLQLKKAARMTADTLFIPAMDHLLKNAVSEQEKEANRFMRKKPVSPEMFRGILAYIERKKN